MEWMGITAMRINNIGYLLKEGIKSIFTHGFMSFAAVCVTVACLLIVGSFSILSYNVNIMVEDLNQTNQTMVYVDDTLSEAEAKSVGTKINMIDNVLQAEFIPGRKHSRTLWQTTRRRRTASVDWSRRISATALW